MKDKSNSNGKIEQQLLCSDKPQIDTINYWSTVNGIERMTDGTIKNVQFSIQEIPKERYGEAISLMENCFLLDEALCKSLKIAEDQNAINDFRLVWNYILKQGISIGAYKMNSDNTLCKLIGMNVLYLYSAELEKDFKKMEKNFKSKSMKRLFEFMYKICNLDICNIYKVNTYLTALGLYVHRDFRGQKIGVHLLNARNLIGQKYGISVTSTLFSGIRPQTQAERAGFETLFRKDYSECLDEDGKPFFPNIEEKEVRVMTKELK